MSKTDQLKSQGKSIPGRRRDNFINLRQKMFACLRTREEWLIEWSSEEAVLEEVGEVGRGARPLVASIWIKTSPVGSH